MNIGIAGSGMIVRVALEALREVEGANVTAISVRERSLAAGQELAERFGSTPSIPTTTGCWKTRR